MREAHEFMAKSTPVKKGIAKLEAELAQAWRDIEMLPVVELAVRNSNVAEYIRHWEGRATAAEALNAELVEALRLALDAHGLMLMSDPPQEAWKVWEVEAKARAALAKAEDV